LPRLLASVATFEEAMSTSRTPTVMKATHAGLVISPLYRWLSVTTSGPIAPFLSPAAARRDSTPATPASASAIVAPGESRP